MNTPQCLLSCGCWQQLPLNFAVEHAAIDCPRHGVVSVIRVNRYEWRVRCCDCRYGRWCGQDEDRARACATVHKRQKPQHNVAVAFDRITWDGKGTVLRMDGTRPRRNPPDTAPRPEMFPLDDVIPF